MDQVQQIFDSVKSAAGVGFIVALFVVAIVAAVLTKKSADVRKMMDREDELHEAHFKTAANTDAELRERLMALQKLNGIEADSFGYE